MDGINTIRITESIKQDMQRLNDTAVAEKIVAFSDSKITTINAHVSPQGNTILHIAVLRSLPKTVRALLTRGAKPNIVNNQRCTALHLAAMTSESSIVEILLEFGADANILNVNDCSALNLALTPAMGQDSDTIRTSALLARHTSLKAILQGGISEVSKEPWFAATSLSQKKMQDVAMTYSVNMIIDLSGERELVSDLFSKDEWIVMADVSKMISPQDDGRASPASSGW